jgi:hypothetical protein
MAGLVQTAVVTPVDLLKVRLQTQSPTAAASTAAGPMRLARHIWCAPFCVRRCAIPNTKEWQLKQAWLAFRG